MSLQISQQILDALTDIDMPKLAPEPPLRADGAGLGDTIPVYAASTVVVGSGAAGLRAAVELKRRGVDVAVLTQSAWGGSSACSGSDKQTLHTANSADQGDNYRRMAAALRAGGAMDEDIAYVEAVGSGRAMASLQFLGLPLPQDQLGGTLRYQTDHDEVGRATSCGPRTSRLMVKMLAQEAIHLAVPIFNQMTVLRVIRDHQGGILGLLAARTRDRTDTNPLGVVFFQTPVIVLAAGGPGELYRDSVFPNGCFGALGLALEAGLELVNLTESQFGIGTRREGFPWNLSGTYMQVIPHIYSVDAAGNEHHFLADYYRTTQELATNIFRKGYQWPFHATRMMDFGSSLIDLAIFREAEQGRQVLMDFNRNILPIPGDLPFQLDRLDEEAKAYLHRAGAVQTLPIDRLRHMNPLAIELYRRYKIDIAVQPLTFTVNNQHMNGGIAVDHWGRSNVSGLYAVGEVAGTHGVTRPGGAALNAGQVFGTRVAEHIAACPRVIQADAPTITQAVQAAMQAMRQVAQPDSPLTLHEIRQEVQARMSEKAGILCTPDEVAEALAQARALNEKIRKYGIRLERPAEWPRLVQWQQMALVSEAVLTALNFYIMQGGGSRGARAILDPAGTCVPMAKTGALSAYRFREERLAHRDEQILIRYVAGDFDLSVRPNRRLDATDKPFFERDWPAWLTGAIYAAGEKNDEQTNA